MLDLNEDGLKPYKFQYIRDVMIEEIACGNLKAHAKLPSIKDVCQSYNLSPVTVRRAYMHLRKRGYIAHLPGLGYFVEDKEDVIEKNRAVCDGIDTNTAADKKLNRYL